MRERKKNLLRYTPDVARAVAAVLNSVNKRKRGLAGEAGDGEEGTQPRDAKQAKVRAYVCMYVCLCQGGVGPSGN